MYQFIFDVTLVPSDLVSASFDPLYPVESIPVNIFLMFVSNNMNEEIIFSNSVPFILEENF